MGLGMSENDSDCAKSKNLQGVSKISSLHISITVANPGSQDLDEYFSLTGLLQFHIFKGEWLVGLLEKSSLECFGQRRRHFNGWLDSADGFSIIACTVWTGWMSSGTRGIYPTMVGLTEVGGRGP